MPPSAGFEVIPCGRSTLRVASTATLANTGRIVLRTGRRSHVGRWILRSELDALILDGISVRASKEGNRLRLSFRYDGSHVRIRCWSLEGKCLHVSAL